MSWIDSLLRPVFSRDLRAVKEGNNVWDVVEIVEKYGQKACQSRTNRALLDRNAIADAALERVQNGGDFAYSGRDRLLELIAATPLYHRNALDVLAKDVREREDWDSARLLGELTSPEDFNQGILGGAQDNLAMSYARLRYALRWREEQCVNYALTPFAQELDNKRSLEEEQRREIFRTIVSFNRFDRLDPETVFHAFCALRIPEANQRAAEMFFRHSEDLSQAVLGQIEMSNWESGGAAPAVLQEITNPERLMAEIREGYEYALRGAFESLRQRAHKKEPIERLARIFEGCVATVKEEANSFGSHDVQIFSDIQIFPSRNFG